MVAPCWSPINAAIGMAPPSRSGSVVPTMPLLSTMSGKAATGTPNRSHNPSSHVSPSSRINIVRLALLASVT